MPSSPSLIFFFPIDARVVRKTRAVSPTHKQAREERGPQTLNVFSPAPPAALVPNNDTKKKHASPRECEINRERERERKKREGTRRDLSFLQYTHTHAHARGMNTHVSSSADSTSSKMMMMMNERERLLASSSSRADGEDDSFSTRFASKRWKAFAVIGSLSLVAAFAGYSSVTSIHNNGVLGSAMHAFGSKEAGASAASRASTKALPVRTAQLGYADVDLDTSALGAKERNMIQASLAIEEVQRKIKRLEKAKRQRALNIQDEDDYLEDEVVPVAAEGDSDAVETATESEVEEGEGDREKGEDLKEQEEADERNVAVKMLTGEDPVVGEDEPKEEESDDDKKEEEEALPQVMVSFVDQKLEEELKEEEKNNDASTNSEESAKEEKDSLEEMALAFQKEMERTALEEELTAKPNEKEVEEGDEAKVTAEDETTAPETDEAMAEKEEEKEEAEGEEKGEETEASTEASVSEEGDDEQKQEEPMETMRAAAQLSSLLKISTKLDLSDSEFSKLEKLLRYNAKKRGIQLKASSSADTTPAQPPKAKLCPTSTIYAGRCECSSCALVLPMPDMVGTSLGKEIDSHECVARMNAQYIEVQNSSLANKLANPRDYGSKTDFVFSNVVEHTLNDLIENLNTTKGKKLNQKVKHKFLHVPFWRPAPEVFDFLEAHNDWKTIPHAVTKETTDLFAQMKGAEGKQWSSGFLAYVMLSRHYCAKTTVYSYWRAEEDPKGQAYVTNSKGGARKMWSGHSFGGEHEFIKNAAENHDYGTRVRYLDALKEGAKREEEVGGIVP